MRNGIPSKGQARKAGAGNNGAAGSGGVGSGAAGRGGAARSDAVAERIARQTLARRETDYAGEIRRLLDAAVDLMRRYGTSSKPRVADIVSAAGLSNEAFYRHFRSKDALVVAILEDGAERLRSYLDHQMSKETTPEAKVARWVKGVLSQAEGEVAATTLAVLWNGGGVEQGSAGRHFASSSLAELLEEPFTQLGSRDPVLHAALASHAVFGKLSDYLWQKRGPSRSEIDKIVGFCVAGAV